MKKYNRLIILALTLLIFNACKQDYIDEISEVAPGTDETAPVINIKSPTSGQLRLLKLGNLLEIDIEIIDDIELKSVSVILDGAEVNTITDFTDYRRYAPIDKEKVDIAEIGKTSHTLKITATDVSGKSTSSEDIVFEVLKYDPVPKYGEVFYMNFDDHYYDLIQAQEATMVGTPGFNTGRVGQAYAGATDAYLTFPTEGLQGDEFSAVFWMLVNSDPDRAGVLTMGPEDVANPGYPTTQNNRTSGFRFFREGSATDQIFKLNAGNGTADSWFDGGAAATVDVTAGNWVHFAYTISNTECVVYLNGVVASQGAFDGIDWTGCDILTIMSGVPRFTEWGHLSDNSLMDELRLFDKALSGAEINLIYDAEKL